MEVVGLFFHGSLDIHFTESIVHLSYLQLVAGDRNEEYLELPVLIYSEVLSSGWCTNIPLLIQSDQPVMIEKGLLAMRALSGTCSFSATSARLRALEKQFESRQNPELDTEYTEHLREHCRALLKDIRKHNLDLQQFLAIVNFQCI